MRVSHTKCVRVGMSEYTMVVHATLCSMVLGANVQCITQQESIGIQ